MSLWFKDCPVCADVGFCNNHPAAPMADPIKPTAADHDAAYALVPFLCAPTFASEVAKAFARHAQQAREQALEEAAKVADFEIKSQPDDDYQLGCTEVASAISQGIRALKEQPPC